MMVVVGHGLSNEFLVKFLQCPVQSMVMGVPMVQYTDSVAAGSDFPSGPIRDTAILVPLLVPKPLSWSATPLISR